MALVSAVEDQMAAEIAGKSKRAHDCMRADAVYPLGAIQRSRTRVLLGGRLTAPSLASSISSPIQRIMLKKALRSFGFKLLALRR